MANSFYDKARERAATTGLSWLAATKKVYLVDLADYTVSLSTHDFADDIPTVAKVATTAALASKTATAGVVDAADTLFAAVTGDPSEALVVWEDSGVQATSPLDIFIDTATGLPVTPNGGDISIQWDSGANRIGKL